MTKKAIIDENNIKKIEINKYKSKITIEIINVIDDERVLCYTTLSQGEVALLIMQLSELNKP
jgi:hypothetical protein